MTTATMSRPAPGALESAGAQSVTRVLRADIQALRALAVASVVLYHLWPHGLPGGYVGVDVFFVISGFLMTKHILTQPTTSMGAILKFWERRARRLLPAATLVLLVTLVLSVIVLPETLLPSTARQVVASAFYVENWELARTATDYLAAGQQPTPVQHFWSLSVEEQFYFIWPLFMGFLLWRPWLRGRGLVLGLSALLAGSLALSWYMTTADAGRAYFVTGTRIWELVLGGVVAKCLHNRKGIGPNVLIRSVSWVGLGCIILAIGLFDSSTTFPGIAAALPTLGAALILLARPDSLPAARSALFRRSEVQWLGGISYSVYLWHWPLVVLAPFVLGHEIDLSGKLAVVGLTLLLAQMTKVLVEDRFRRLRLVRSTLRTFAMAACCIGMVLAAGAGAIAISTLGIRSAEATVRSASVQEECFAAAAARDPGCRARTIPLFTSPAFAQADKPVTLTSDCLTISPYASRTACTFGSKTPVKRVALVGNSHAAHWQPAIEAVADKNDWSLTTYLISKCYTVDVMLKLRTQTFSENCRDWNRWMMTRTLEGGYDLIVISDRTALEIAGVSPGGSREAAERAYTRTLRQWTSAGLDVLVIRDVPGSLINVPDCVAQHLDEPQTCVTDRRALDPDPLADAGRADTTGKVSVLDLTSTFCDVTRCHSVIGGVIVYFDFGHLTRTFSESLAPDVETAMRRRMAGAA